MQWYSVFISLHTTRSRAMPTKHSYLQIVQQAEDIAVAAKSAFPGVVDLAALGPVLYNEG